MERNLSDYQIAQYTEDDIKTLEGLEHVRQRPGMYIGKLGDGSQADDGIYVLLKEILDNSIDEFRMGFGKIIEVTIDNNFVSVRDYGRGIPFKKMLDSVSIMNTSGKFDDSKAFNKSVGLNGVGSKAVNALSSPFVIKSVRDDQEYSARFEAGKLIEECEPRPSTENSGTLIQFQPDSDKKIFGNYAFQDEYIENMLRNYAYLNTGLTILYNGRKFLSKNGLSDLLNEKLTSDNLYPIVHLKGEDIEIAFTHADQSGEDFYSYVNGQYTSQGGTHQSAYREALARTIKEFYNKNFEMSDVRSGIIAAIAISIENPIFESQTKIKLGSKEMGKNGVTVAKFVGDFVKKEVDNYLHKNAETADILQKKITESEKERKAISDIQKKSRNIIKKASLHNSKLRDCRVHYNSQHALADGTMIFITEGDSASGSITKSRNVSTQAVFSLKGKPINSFKESRSRVFTNEEFNLLRAALNVEDGIENLRYNKVIIATDADDDGMHIRLLLVTMFLLHFPDIISHDHLYILQTPLFRVRNKKETLYCYSEEERKDAIEKLKPSPEITRFKGLGEISPDEFKDFIDVTKMRLDPVKIKKDDSVKEMIKFYMGDNTPLRQDFIIKNLRVEEDAV
ncbi:type IIA DNA topoisomerase subunit B [Bacteroidales bacterium OttesenSCG-928-J16]|nr:type IIA DNA topoisomerase subunit B [Bacteroidales bacterium OttesenSCG-928-J16]